MALKKIEGVEIFSAGTWNEDIYTVQDLDEMVKAFNETGETCRPYIKLGHNEDQRLLREDGLPAAGWIGKLYRSGEKLLADFIDIPEKIYQLIENKAYRNVSSEIYWDIDMGEKSYKRMLAAVALLGAEMPAVSNLKDILAMYKAQFKNIGAQKSYELEKDTLTIKTYQDSDPTKEARMPKTVEELEAELTQLKADKQASDDKVTELAEKYAASEAEKHAAKVDLEVTELLQLEGSAPAMKPYLKELLGQEKKVYKFKASEKEVELSKADLLKEVIKLSYAKANVNVTEKTIDGEKIEQGKDLDAEIQKYSSEHKVTYAEAYKAVCKKHGVALSKEEE